MTELLTLDEVAARLRVSRRTVERLVRAGRIRALRISERRIAVEAREVDAFVAAARKAA